ncbi:AAA family ATPase, partial [Sulfuricurvum sp.]|uniref:AAA family ATPase n=1 Tax=Sulfuricurvum sp. TaxID=2025608 RepID=UPI003BB65510
YTNKVKVTSSLKIENFTISFLRKVLYYSMDNLNLAESRSYLTTINLSKTNELITENYLKLQNLDFELFNFKPHGIEYSFRELWLNSEYEHNELDIAGVKSALGWEPQSDPDVIIDAIRALKNLQDEYMLYLFSRFEGIDNIFEKINLTEKLDSKNFNLTVTTEEVETVLKKCAISFVEKEKYELLKKHAGVFIKIENIATIFGTDYLDLFFHTMIDELEFDFRAENSATYSSLSHGQKTIYSFIVNLVSYNQKEFLFFLDEPDNTLHPNWQKKFINELISIAKKLEKKVHLIITSHSPFILSDIPKENVIFLKDGKEEKVDIDTFGANIHTLLSHGFFMDDGLMGEFAKSKINEIIDFYNEVEKHTNNEIKKAELKVQYEEKKEAFWNIQSIIGEAYLKQVVKNHLVEIEKILLGKDEAKSAEISRVKVYLESLEND